jgi:hypothetical protein
VLDIQQEIAVAFAVLVLAYLGTSYLLGKWA